MTDEVRELLLTPASQIETKRQRWLWRDRIPLGTCTGFAGRGGEGKSTFALYLTALANRGHLEGDLKGRKIPALIISHEDDWSTVMNPRLQGAGADLDHVYKLSIQTVVDETTLETVPALPLDLQLIRQAVTETGARLIIVDPLTATIGGDLHKLADVRRAIDPLTALAQELDIAVIAILHFNKGQGNASDKVAGSHAFRDAFRSLLLFATDDESGERIVTVDKSNYSQEKGESFAFNLVSQTVHTDDGEQTDVGVVQFLGATDKNVSEIINRQHGEDGDDDDRHAAQQFLLDYLKGKAGYEANAAEAIKAGRAAGFNETEMKNARKRCKSPKIASRKSGFGAGWVWGIETDEPQGVTKASKVSLSRKTTPSTPSTTPSEPQLATVTPIGDRK